MRVLHVITGLGVGGAELQLRALLQHTRHDAEVVTLYNAGPVADMIRADGISVRDLGMTSNTQLSAVFALRRMIRAGRFDVVHAHLYRSQVYGRLAAWLAGTPVVVSTEHSIGDTHLERRRMTRGVQALYLATGLVSQATIAVSETVRERLANWGVPARKLVLIPNGVDFSRVAFDPAARQRTRHELGIDADERVIGVLGRLDPNKRFDLVIRAARPLLDARTRLLIVGDGSERRRWEAVAAGEGVADRVIFAGERHDVAAFLSTMDLFVASSAQEAFGLSVLEALANGLPVLYTTCPAMEGVDTDRARLVPGTVEDMRAALAHDLGEIDAGRWERVEVSAVRQRYGIESVADQVDGLYERLIARRRPGRHAATRPRTPTSASQETATETAGTPVISTAGGRQ
ncbi:MAG TPA: glycosyltransferase [Pseudonocardiaceae bacterium]